MSFWRGMALVMGREVRERARARSFRWITALLLAAGVAFAVLPSVLGGDDDPAPVAVSGGPPGLDEALSDAGEALGEPVRPVAAADAGAARRAVAAGDAEAALAVDAAGDARVVVERELGEGMRAVITSALSSARLAEGLARAGVPPAERRDLLAPPDLAVDAVAGDEADPGSESVGLLVAALLYIALVFTGVQVATGVAEEKTSRISEVLLASLRPTQLLVGKVAGIGALGLGQLAVLVLPAVAALTVTDAVALPDATAETLLLGLVWFAVGFALYGVAYAALGALVARQEEVGSITTPLTLVLVGGYLLALAGIESPDDGLLRGLALLPPFAPMTMPARLAEDASGVLDLVVALVLALVATAALAWLGARIYRGGLVRTGKRTRLRDALRPE